MSNTRWRWLRDRRRIASAVVVALVIGTIAALSLNYRGVASADVELNDGGVWVTNEDSILVGRLNYPVRKIDATIAADTLSVDVLQREDVAVVWDANLGTLRRVDTANVVFSGPAVAIPGGAEVAMGNAAVAVLDSNDGRLWVTSPGSLPVLEDTTVEPTYAVGEGSHLAVGDDGTVFVVDPINNEVLKFAPQVWAALANAALEGSDSADATDAPSATDGATDGATEQLAPQALVFGEGTDLTDSEVQIAAVGGRSVVLAWDRETGATTMFVDAGEPIDLSSLDADFSTARLQASSVTGSQVAISTTDGVALVPLDGSDPRVIANDQPGSVVQPVQVNGCVHAAWSGTVPTYLRVCGDGDPEAQAVPQATAGSEVKFRVNRTNVVLNDLRTGDVWMLEDRLVLVEDWEDAISDTTDETETDNPSEEETDEVPLDREAENRDPVANPDEFGVRPGAITLLQVVKNDTDPDGDLLTASNPTGLPESFGTVEVILGGRALQVRVAPDARGTAEFEYTVDDGRTGTDSTTVTLTVRGPSENSSPEQTGEITATTVLGGTTKVNLLNDVIDPDGDPIYLTSADPNDNVNISLRPDGVVSLTDLGITTGPKQIVVYVSDGRSEAVPVTIDLEVLPDGPVPPVAVFDFESGFVDERIVVKPLVNDLDPNGRPLTLSVVTPTNGGDVELDAEAGEFTFSASTAGDYYLVYTVTDDDGLNAEGLVRINLRAPQDVPPIAVADTALLPPAGQVSTDVLANDTDPSGGVLAVQSIDVPEGFGLQVAILDHRVLRISSELTLSGPVEIGYTVSNGSLSSQGQLTVIPMQSESDTQPPSPQPDQAVVRTGDYVTIPALRNDSHPNGLPFTITSLEVPDGMPGIPFIAGDLIRYAAPDDPGTYQFGYTVTDERGQSRSTQVTVYVEARGDAANAPPTPADVQVRAFAGERIRIPFDLFGIDPDGDSVRLVGPVSSPERGRIVEIGAGYIDYVAYNTVEGGTDTFEYAVQDRLGEVGQATVTIGIIPPPTENRPPVTGPDHITVRPDRDIQTDVLANDTDPDGDQLQYGDPAIVDAGGLEVEIVDGLVAFRAPTEPGDYTIQYLADDTHGGTDIGSLTVTVDPNADPLPPVGVDDVVPATQLIDAQAVTVDVLANDYDPDGSTDDLTVSVALAPDGVTVLDDNTLRIPVPQTREVITYMITDLDGETTYAFVEVPGLTDTGPVLLPGVSLEVLSGETLTIPLNDYVVALSGDPVQLYDNDNVTATNSNGGPYVVDEQTLQFISADGYSGPASITFSVTDATDINATDIVTSVVTIPITVLPVSDQPPTFRNGSLTVEAGGDSATLDLTRFADDPDTEVSDLSFELGDVPAGITVALDSGVIMTASADIDVPAGSTIEIPVTVTDGTTDPVTGTITLSVVATTVPPMVANNDDLGDIDQGQSQTVSVLDNDTNPLGGARTIVDAFVETGSGTATISGSNVVVTPAADYDGQFVVTYTVQDATGDPDRWAQARITATVLGVPDVPARPAIVEVGSRQVTLDLTPPNDNGSPITQYLVTGSDGQTTTCTSTRCIIDGLTNGTTYTFTVVAVNAVGESAPSAVSAEATPDQKPGPVAAPAVTYDDSQLSLTWTNPVNEGTPITSFDIQISSPGTDGVSQQSVDGSTFSYTWSNLRNGEQYRFRIRAHNSHPDPGDWGDWSRLEYPSAPPAAPAAPTMSRIDTPAGGQVEARWTAPANNGDAISVYHVTLYQNGVAISTVDVPGGTLSRIFEVTNGNNYSVSVIAENRSGPGPSSPQSAAVVSFGQPGVVPGVSLAATGVSGQLQVSYGAAANNGQAIQRYEYLLSSGASGTLGTSPAALNGLANGTSYTVQVRACNTYCGAWSAASNPASPYGPPATPPSSGNISSSASGQTVAFSWRYPSTSNGAAITAVQYELDGATKSGSVTGSDSVRGDWEQNHTFRMRVQNEHGQWSGWSTVRNQRAEADPTPPVSLTPYRGDSITCQNGGGTCYQVSVRYANLPAVSGGYTISYHIDNNVNCDTMDRSYSNVAISGNGNHQTTGHYGSACTGNTVTFTVSGGGETYTGSGAW